MPLMSITDDNHNSVPMQAEQAGADLPDLPKVVLKKRRALPFFSRHPWVFAGAIARIEGGPVDGAEVLLVTDRGEFVARGLFNSQSNIRVRLYSWDVNCPIDEALFSQRLDDAIRLRTQVLKLEASESACRLVFSEADGLSGLTVDRYDNWLVVQFTSLALASRQEMLIDLLKSKLSPAGIWLRTEKGIREAEGLDCTDGLLDGEPPPQPLFIKEHGVRYGLDLVAGQKTGFYIDQRDNRAAFARYTHQRRLLDVFCYSGGFGLTAVLQGDAKSVLGIDASETALRLARANAELNGVASKARYERADAFEKLEQLSQTGERFGAIVLDPPKMARHRKAVPAAIKGYARLHRLAFQLLEPDGILASCSCSGLVTQDEFEGVLAKAAVESGRNLQILESRGPSPDHPISVFCPENEYLRCYICRVT